MIAIIDYGMGNLGSVANAFKSLGVDIKVTTSPKDLKKAKKIVLPGVGAFSYAMQSLRKMKIIPALLSEIDSAKPYLGLCLGMQVLFEESEEGEKCKGLGVLKGKVKKFNFTSGQQPATSNRLKIPHMGWNQIKINKQHPEYDTGECPMMEGIPDGAWMYFVHSYYVEPEDKNVIATTTDYGAKFTSMVCTGNIFATQFHPEKSQAVGMRMLENFVRL